MAAKRILLVEDETGISDFLTIALCGEGYEIGGCPMATAC
jgi:DNA-binding response OmpR family regulator